MLLINKFHSHLQEIKNTSNMNLNHLITPCKPPACSNTTTHHKTNHRHNKYNAYKYWHQIKYYSSHLINNTHSHLQEMKNTLNIYLLFITSNQQYSFTFVRNEKHSQYVFKSPYNTMQATCLLQHNNPPQNQFSTSQVYIEFYKFLTRIYLLCSH